uniref:RRM domain-containing protein n=1 Tax=Alexandrium catenella TaxID=2925 RepID=A0A7S1M3C4_ALECA
MPGRAEPLGVHGEAVADDSPKAAVAAAAAATAAAASAAEAAADAISAKLGSAEHPVHDPEGYDVSATLVVANLPQSASSFDVGAFFSWYAPVVHVERLPTSVTGTDANFLVTFVDSASASHVLQAGVGFYEGELARPIRLRPSRTGGEKSSWFW